MYYKCYYLYTNMDYSEGSFHLAYIQLSYSGMIVEDLLIDVVLYD